MRAHAFRASSFVSTSIVSVYESSGVTFVVRSILAALIVAAAASKIHHRFVEINRFVSCAPLRLI